MKCKIIFNDVELDFLIQVINKFMFDANLSDFSLKNKLLLNENSFYVEEIEFLYLYLKSFKQTIEKCLDAFEINDENLRLNYKGVNHCLRKCRKALESLGINLLDLSTSYDEFFNSFSEKFI